jgi:hypothetical protein
MKRYSYLLDCARKHAWRLIEFENDCEPAISDLGDLGILALSTAYMQIIAHSHEHTIARDCGRKRDANSIAFNIDKLLRLFAALGRHGVAPFASNQVWCFYTEDAPDGAIVPVDLRFLCCGAELFSDVFGEDATSELIRSFYEETGLLSKRERSLIARDLKILYPRFYLDREFSELIRSYVHPSNESRSVHVITYLELLAQISVEGDVRSGNDGASSE